ncbi:MAG: magnesium transporter [Actinomycetota bacterium]
MKTPTPDRAETERARRTAALDSARLAAGVAIKPAKAALRAPRASARGLREVFRYWHAERATLRQGFVAVWLSSAGDLLAGLALGIFTHRLDELPGLIILVPAAIGMRGNIFGALGNRLGTAVHAGSFRVTRARSGILFQNVYAATLLSLVMSAFLAVTARVVSVLTGGPSISLWGFMVVSVVGGIFSSAVVLALTVLLSLVAFRKGWDLDSVAAPVVTFMGDTVTLPALFLASYLIQQPGATLALGALLGALAIWALVSALRTDLPLARRILRESLIVLVVAGVVDIIAGIVIERRAHHFFTLPALAVLIPPFLEDAGALGSVLGGRLGSKLHLGAIEPRFLPERLALLDMSLLAPWGLSVFLLVGVSSHYVARAVGLASPGLPTMIAVSLTAGLISTIGAAWVAYSGAVATYRFGFDPDNHAVPIVTSSIDLIGTIALVGTVIFLGVR